MIVWWLNTVAATVEWRLNFLCFCFLPKCVWDSSALDLTKKKKKLYINNSWNCDTWKHCKKIYQGKLFFSSSLSTTTLWKVAGTCPTQWCMHLLLHREQVLLLDGAETRLTAKFAPTMFVCTCVKPSLGTITLMCILLDQMASIYAG